MKKSKDDFEFDFDGVVSFICPCGRSYKNRTISSKKKAKKIAEHYGYEAQSRQTIEEMAELTQAINKLWRADQGDDSDIEKLKPKLDHIKEEMVDVQIMLWQLEVLLEFNISEHVDKKLDRQLARMKKEKERRSENGKNCTDS